MGRVFLAVEEAEAFHRTVALKVIDRPAFDEEALQKVASTTLGEYFRAPNANELKKIYRTLGAKLAFEKQRPTEVTAVFAGIGALLASVAALLSMLWFNRIL